MSPKHSNNNTRNTNSANYVDFLSAIILQMKLSAATKKKDYAISLSVTVRLTSTDGWKC